MMRVITLAAATVAMMSASACADSSIEQDPPRRMAALEQPDYSAATRAAHTRRGPMKITITQPSNATPQELSAAPAGDAPETVRYRPKLRAAGPHEILAGAAIHEPPTTLRGASDLNCVAVAIYHEARNQSDFGQRAVASVILQRVAVEHRWGDSPCKVVIPVQFSFLLKDFSFEPIDEWGAWEKAVRFAALALIEGPLPELFGADHYHTDDVDPYWAPKMKFVRGIQDHLFYTDPASRRG